MSVAMLVILLMMVGIGVAGFRLGARQLPPPAAPPQDLRLSEQAERIELLEGELQRVKEQADFTERLLTERSGTQPGGAVEGDVKG